MTEGRPFPKWHADEVRRQAANYFRGGKPFEPPLKAPQQTLQDLNTIRNAVAHDSQESWDKFKTLVRRELKGLPLGLTVGKYLDTARPGINPPVTFMEHYLQTLLVVAEKIVK